MDNNQMKSIVLEHSYERVREREKKKFFLIGAYPMF